jgi:hypothetical protein
MNRTKDPLIGLLKVLKAIHTLFRGGDRGFGALFLNSLALGLVEYLSGMRGWCVRGWCVRGIYRYLRGSLSVAPEQRSSKHRYSLYRCCCSQRDFVQYRCN